MFSMPTSFADFFVKCLKTLPYVAVINGLIFGTIGLYFVYSASAFSARSVVQEVSVVSVDSRRSDNGTVYRPLFKALQDDGTSVTYSGSAWVSPKPHNDGDISKAGQPKCALSSIRIHRIEIFGIIVCLYDHSM